MLGPTVAAWLIGGATVGAAESAWILGLATAWPAEHSVLRWGALLYGLVGALAGAGVGAAAPVALGRRRAEPLDVLCRGLAVVLAASLLIVFRFRYQRDVLHELPLGLAREAAWLGASLATGLLCWSALPRVLQRWTAHLGWRACTLAWLTVVAPTVVAAQLLPRSGTTPFQPAPGASRTHPHILYLMLDTVRADVLSPYGATDIETPASTRLSADGIVFTQAISQSSWTRPSVATQLTSLPPNRHGARYKSSSLRGDAVPLAEALSAAGYYCVGFYDVGHIGPEWGFARGYHRYRSIRASALDNLALVRVLRGMWLSWRRPTLRAEEIHGSAEQLLHETRTEWTAAPRGAPIFFFVHLMDAHDPYFSGSAPGAILRDDRAGMADRNRLRAAYRDGVASADAKVQALLRWLESEGLYDDMLIVLVSDHGEEFFEHGGYWHGLTLYDEQIHVPLIVKLPQRRLAGTRQPALVRLLDLAPTVAAVAGVAPPPQWMGIPLIRDGGLVDPHLPHALSETDLEGGAVRALRGTRDKLILAAGRDRRGLPARALFDLGVDAGEQRNLAADRDDEVRRLTVVLTRERDGDLWR